MRSLPLFIVAILLSIVVRVSAQERPSYGLYGHFVFNMHTANFQHLPGVPNCCPRFENGAGTGVALGALYDLPFSPLLSLQLRAGYQSLSGLLLEPEGTTVLHEGVATVGEFEHRLDATLSTIGIEPLLGFSVIENVRIYGGLRAGVLMAKTYEQREEISKPDGAGTFLDSLGNDTHSRIRNQFSGDIPDASSFQMALLGGASYTLPLNARRTLFLSPEAFYSLGLTPIASGLEWSVNSLRVGVAVTYRPTQEKAVAPPPVAVDTAIATPKPLPKPLLSVAVNAFGVEPDGTEEPAVRLMVEEFSSTLMTPLLNYVFFDESSSQIPSRYQTLRPDNVDAFNIDGVNSPAKLQTYHHLLNIIGRRLRDNPKAKLTLTGCNQDIRDEQGKTELSKSRAEAVRDYLKNVWGIDENRMKIEARNLPAKAANTQTQDGAEENRRVEITSDDARILAPVTTNDTLRTTSPPSVRFKPMTTSEAGVASWRLTAMQDGKTLKTFAGTGPVPQVLEWHVNDETGTTPRYEGNLTYTLSVTDATGAEVHTDNTIPVEQLTISKKRVERLGDKEIDRSSLILFDVRSSEVSPAGTSIIALLKDRIKPNSTVTVTGYTDRLGEPAYNQQLAESRAATVAKALATSGITSKGVGQADLYDNSLPEGRLYTRTVDVVIETPVR